RREVASPELLERPHPCRLRRPRVPCTALATRRTTGSASSGRSAHERPLRNRARQRYAHLGEPVVVALRLSSSPTTRSCALEPESARLTALCAYPGLIHLERV